MSVGFDLISDLNVTNIAEFNWEGKPTSLYCLVPGNISSDLNVVNKVLLHLSKCYQGVFYIDGRLENPSLMDRGHIIQRFTESVSTIPNLIYLHNNVVVVDGIAIIGVNGWSDYPAITDDDTFQLKSYRYDDLIYLEQTTQKLQLHPDVKKIIVMSNSVPSLELYFGEIPNVDIHEIGLQTVLEADTEQKITHWVFGSHNKIVDTIKDNINYINNPKFDSAPYYAKRITL
jgi:hypothetical protein